MKFIKSVWYPVWEFIKEWWHVGILAILYTLMVAVITLFFCDRYYTGEINAHWDAHIKDMRKANGESLNSKRSLDSVKKLLDAEKKAHEAVETSANESAAKVDTLTAERDLLKHANDSLVAVIAKVKKGGGSRIVGTKRTVSKQCYCPSPVAYTQRRSNKDPFAFAQ
jgi:hypothetical protein